MGIRGDFVRRERAELCADLVARGPDQPTLCTGWQTRDLLEHLVAREFVTARTLLRGKAALEAELRSATWPDLIERLRSGPPRYSVFGLPGVDAAANAEEFFVHHEDIRRASPGWVRRTLPPDMEEAFWRRLGSPLGRLALRRVDVGVHLRRPGGQHVTLRAARPGVVIDGEPSELLLFVFGRVTAAEVQLTGPADARDRLLRARLGV